MTGPFLVLEGTGHLGARNSRGLFYPDGLRWRVDPGRELSRFAARAMQAIGTSTKWQEIEDLAQTALNDLAVISRGLATMYKQELNRPDMDANRLVLIHGPADLLASGRIWKDVDDWAAVDEQAIKDSRHMQNDGRDGSCVLAAFALLMADYAANELTRSETSAAVDLLAIGANALAYATMGRATSDAAKAAFRQRTEASTAKAKVMAQARHLPLEKHRTRALEMAQERAFPTRIAAARHIAENLVKGLQDGKDTFYTPETIDGWLKNAGL